MPPKL